MDIETLIFLSMTISIFGVSFLFLFYKTQQNTTKKKQPKTNNDISIEVANQNIRLMQESYTSQIKQLREELTSTQRSLSRYKGLLKKYQEENDIFSDDDNDDNDESLEFAEQYELDLNKAKEYASKMGLDSNGLSDPELMPLMWEKIKEHQDLALMLGIIRRRGRMETPTQNQQNSGQSGIDATAQALIDNGQYA